MVHRTREDMQSPAFPMRTDEPISQSHFQPGTHAPRFSRFKNVKGLIRVILAKQLPGRNDRITPKDCLAIT